MQGNDSRLATVATAWTPEIRFGGVADDGAKTLSSNKYVRVGKFVELEGRFAWTSFGTKTGVVTIAGIQVAASSQAAIPAGMAVFTTGGASIAGAVIVRIVESTIYLDFQGTTAVTSLTHANFSNTSDLRFSMRYTAA